MTHQAQTTARLTRTGRSHLATAQHVVTAAGDAATAMLPGTASYLAHVALECVLKARLLYRAGCASKEELEAKNPALHEAMFTGKRAHDIERVAKDLRLPKLMETQGKSLNTDGCWRRMTLPLRPYSLRYGAEDVTANEAAEEVSRAQEIIAAVLGGMPAVPLSGMQRTRRR